MKIWVKPKYIQLGLHISNISHQACTYKLCVKLVTNMMNSRSRKGLVKVSTNSSLKLTNVVLVSSDTIFSQVK